jgi:6-phosphogluconolactonase
VIDVRVLPDAPSLANVVAEALLTLVGAPPAEEVHEIALTGGTIADAVHRQVALLRGARDIDWASVRFWWGDERFVDESSPERNCRQARRALLDSLPLPPGAVMEVPGTDSAADVVAAAQAYATQVRHEGAREFSLVMLGIGPDGHVASLFPGHPAVSTTDAITVAVTDSPKPPPERVSLTFEALNRSREVWFVASGREKAEAVARSVAAQRSGVGEISLTPAYGIGHPDHVRHGAEPPRITWWLDADSAHLLT